MRHLMLVMVDQIEAHFESFSILSVAKTTYFGIPLSNGVGPKKIYPTEHIKGPIPNINLVS